MNGCSVAVAVLLQCCSVAVVFIFIIEVDGGKLHMHGGRYPPLSTCLTNDVDMYPGKS